MKRLLIVEDNPEYSRAILNLAARGEAQKLSESGFNACAVSNFSSFKGIYDSSHMADFHGALVDCFFPYAHDSPDRTYGESTIRKLTDVALHERLNRDVAALANEFDISNPRINSVLRGMAFAAHQSGTSLEDYLPFKAIRHIGETVHKDIANQVLQLPGVPQDTYVKDVARGDFFASMMDYMAKDSANQPLGIEVAHALQEKNVPFVLCTSTYHHDNQTQAIQNYCSRHGWEMIDCHPGLESMKLTPLYWTRALESLERRMQK